MDRFWTAVSFGGFCSTRAQLERRFGRAFITKGIFDWQVTPAAAAVEYIAADFRGLFEREDLQLGPRGVTHRRLLTEHPHEFPADVTEETLSAGYEQARARHDYLCEKLRGLLSGSTAVLIAISAGNEPVTGAGEVERALRRRYARLDFRLVALGADPEQNDEECWRGNPDLWDSQLAGMWPINRWRRLARDRLLGMPARRAQKLVKTVRRIVGVVPVEPRLQIVNFGAFRPQETPAIQSGPTVAQTRLDPPN